MLCKIIFKLAKCNTFFLNMLVSGIPDLGSYDCYNSCCCDKILNKKKIKEGGEYFSPPCWEKYSNGTGSLSGSSLLRTFYVQIVIKYIFYIHFLTFQIDRMTTESSSTC